MIKRLSDLGVTSNMAYIASFGSILASIAIWNLRRKGDRAGAERFGIFVGLWAPTFAILARGLEESERSLLS